jgi:hypothetical protein
LLFEQVVRAAAGTPTRLDCGPMAAPGWIDVFEFAAELLDRTGFRDVARCRFGRTAVEQPDIVTLDDREREMLFAEATR